ATIAGLFAYDQVGEALGFAGGIGEVVFTQGHEGHAFELDGAVALGATISAIAGIGLGFIYWWGTAERAARAREWVPEIHDLLVNRYYIDNLYQFGIDYVVLGFASALAYFDRWVVNETGVDGTGQGINFTGYRLKFVQTGRIPNYALAMGLGVVVLALVALGRT
ncbi:MAG: hypothetical protein O2895_05195, partial [Chloroflexi bacterium]|nr:hypothetical protein [Chloroflexota bacterium]